jgi:hypothetical protein
MSFVDARELTCFAVAATYGKARNAAPSVVE